MRIGTLSPPLLPLTVVLMELDRLIVKLALMPAIVWALAVCVFRLPDLQAGVATILAALPSGINPFIVARHYDVFVARAARALAISTVISIVTVALLLARYAPVP